MRLIQRLFATALAAALVLAVVVAVLVLVTPGTSYSGPDDPGTIARVGGLDYRALDARMLHPTNLGDRRMLRGAGSAGAGQVWFGAFLTAENPAREPLPMARRFALRDVFQRDHRPVPLAPGNPFAYRARTVAPGAQSPGVDAVAQRDLAAEGGLLLFRVPRSAYEAGPLELRIGDPAHPGEGGDLILGS